MSIVKLTKITAYGRAEDKERILADLQDRGCLHVIPLRVKEDLLRKVGPTSESREALKFLGTCPQRRQQSRNSASFDATAVEHEALDLKRCIEKLEDDRDFLRVRIRDMRPWGYFDFPSLDETNNLRLWFYAVPHVMMDAVEATELDWYVAAQDNRFDYLVVISEHEPEGMPVLRTKTGSMSLGELEGRLVDAERQIEKAQADRADLTRWIELFTRSIYRLEDHATLVQVSGQTHDDEPVFVLQAWAPKREVEKLRNYALGSGLALEIEKPAKDEEPPTLLENKRAMASGQDLVSFYRTPGYWLWDPSGIVFYSFAIFFAMIISDAAYGTVLGLILGLLWKKMGRSGLGKRLRLLGCVLVVATIAYGVMVGSYFGVSPPDTSFLDRLKIIDMNNFSTMMKISIYVGVVHLIIANLADMWRLRWSFGMLAPVGWICMWVGGMMMWQGFDEKASIVTMVVGASLILLFTTVRGPLWKRILGGFQGMARLSSAFGDTLSYLRLFALGLASASLAMTFNDLAREVGEGVPGIGLLFSLLIIVLGHALNLVLAVASGVIHGLRLNFIEFFNWGLSEEGYPFRAFERKEKATWTTSSSH